MKKKLSDRYLDMLWREAVLAEWNNQCGFCGAMGELECHHIVYRRNRVLRWDYRNGFPVCKGNDLWDGKTCHGFAHTKLGEKKIIEVLEDYHYDYLCKREQMTLKDFLVQEGVSKVEFYRQMADELKDKIKEKRERGLI